MKQIFVSIIVLFIFITSSFTEDKKMSSDSQKSFPTDWSKIIKSSKPEDLKGKILNVNTGSFVDFDELIKDISGVTVVFIGETRDQLTHHQVQNKILSSSYNKNKSIVIGMEIFQKSHQKYLDEYLDDKISEREMLRKTEYLDQWGYNWEFYQPMTQFAKDKNLKIIALNTLSEISRKVAAVGLDGLDKNEKQLIPPEINTFSETHKKYFKSIYDTELHSQPVKFDNYYNALCIWENSIADSITSFFKVIPSGENKTQLIVLAGNEHIIYKFGIPDCMSNQIKLPYRTIVPISITESTNPLIEEFMGVAPADYLWFTETIKQEKPEIGIKISPINIQTTGLRISEVILNTPAEKAKLKTDDIILAMDGEFVNKPNDLRLLMIGKKIGAEIEFTIIRNNHEFKVKIKL